MFDSPKMGNLTTPVLAVSFLGPQRHGMTLWVMTSVLRRLSTIIQTTRGRTSHGNDLQVMGFCLVESFFGSFKVWFEW